MPRMETRAGVFGVLLALGTLSPSGALSAAEDEVRVFAVTIDKKHAGFYRMTTKVGPDGTETTTITADVKVRILVVNYRYTLHCTEVWKAGQFVSVEAYTDDDGKKTNTKAVAREGGLMVTANGAAKRARSDAVLNTGYRLRDTKAQIVSMFDIQDGSETPCRMEALGPGRVTVNGQAIDGQRYRFTGKNVDAEWWFDGAGRPIRQLMVSDGHNVVLTLSQVTH